MEQRDVVAALEGYPSRVAAQEVRSAEEEDLHPESLGTCASSVPDDTVGHVGFRVDSHELRANDGVSFGRYPFPGTSQVGGETCTPARHGGGLQGFLLGS